MEMENIIFQMELSIKDNSKKVYSMEWDVYQIKKELHNYLDIGQMEISLEIRSLYRLKVNNKIAF